MATLTLKEILDMVGDHNGTISLVINVVVQPESSTTPGPTPPPPTPSTTRYQVVTGDKPNKQVKVRSEPTTTSSEINYVYDGNFVNVIRMFNGFAQITDPAGYVEEKYLTKA